MGASLLARESSLPNVSFSWVRRRVFPRADSSALDPSILGVGIRWQSPYLDPQGRCGNRATLREPIHRTHIRLCPASYLSHQERLRSSREIGIPAMLRYSL